MKIALPNYEPQIISLALIRRLINAEPPPDPKEIRDNRNNLILRHQPSGYIGLYVELGRGKRERLCDARDIADPQHPLTLGRVKKRAASIRGQSADGRNFQAERGHAAGIPTLAEYLSTDKDKEGHFTRPYAAWLGNHRRSGTATLARIKAAFVDFLTCRLDTITADKLEPWKAGRLRAVTHETINRDLAALRAALGRAVRLKILHENPLANVEMMPVDRNRQPVRALTANEKAALLLALAARDDDKRAGRHRGNNWRAKRGYSAMPGIGLYADCLNPAVVVSMETGLRRGELFALQWPSVDFTAKALRVEGATAKTFETREIPLNKPALTALRDWWLQHGQPGSGYVFSQDDTPIHDLKKSYHATLKAAGIERCNARGERITWHSLRHTFGTLLGAQNVDATTLMVLMGHAKLATTQRYLHTDADRKRAAVALLEAM